MEVIPSSVSILRARPRLIMFRFRKTRFCNTLNFERLNCGTDIKLLKQRKKTTVNNKKTHLADFETCVFRVYPRNHFSYKKVI